MLPNTDHVIYYYKMLPLANGLAGAGDLENSFLNVHIFICFGNLYISNK